MDVIKRRSLIETWWVTLGSGQWLATSGIFFVTYLLCLEVKDANLRVRSFIAKYIFVFNTINTKSGTTYETTLVTAMVTWKLKIKSSWMRKLWTVCISMHRNFKICIYFQLKITLYHFFYQELFFLGMHVMHKGTSINGVQIFGCWLSK